MSFKISKALSSIATKILGEKKSKPMSEEEKRTKNQETKKIKLATTASPVVGKELADPTSTTMPEETTAEDYIPVVNGKGTLMVASKDLNFVLMLSNNTSSRINKDENLLVLHMFENIKTKETAIIFLTEQKKYLYVTETFKDDFVVISEGNETDKLE
jgi:hypothetical protein